MPSIDISHNSFFLSAVSAAVLSNVIPGVRWRALAISAAFAAGSSIALSLAFRAETPWDVRLALAGAGSILIQLGRTYLVRSRDLRAEVLILFAMVLPGLGAVLIVPALAFVSRLTPETFDYYLYAYDGAFGVQPGFWTARLLLGSAWIRIPCEICYVNLPVAMTAVFLLRARESRAAANRVFKAYVILALAGLCSYVALPAVGSLKSFSPEFPFSEPHFSRAAIHAVNTPADIARNCMPSLHAAWTLSLFWFTYRLGWIVRVGAGILAASILTYSLGCGHYAVDLVASAPFAVAAYILVSEAPLRTKAGPALACFVLFAAWIVAIRFFPSLPANHAPTVVAALIATVVIAAACKSSFTSRHERSL